MAMAMATTGGRPGGVFPAEERDLSSWPHEGHRLWAALPEAFWVYIFKVKRCPHQGSHDWTLCPYAHRGERARRRDPRRHAYMGVACPDYRASQEHHAARGTGEAPTCVRGLTCRYAHGVFELWLHPTRFRTRMCDAGAWCPRRICFFAHRAEHRRREDDPVPFVTSMAVMTPPPPRPRVVEVPASPLPRRSDMVMRTRSGDKQLPLLQSSSFSSSSSAFSPVYLYGTSSDGSSGSSSSRLAELDSNSDNDNLPDFHAILDMLDRLVMD